MRVCGGWVILPWLGVSEDTMECGLGCDRDGYMNGEGVLSLCDLGSVVIGDGSFNFADVGYHFIVANGVEPLWGGEVFSFCSPNLVSEAADGGVEGREPGGKVKIFVAAGDGAADDKVGIGVPPGVQMEFVEDLLESVVTCDVQVKCAVSEGGGADGSEVDVNYSGGETWLDPWDTIWFECVGGDALNPGERGEVSEVREVE